MSTLYISFSQTGRTPPEKGNNQWEAPTSTAPHHPLSLLVDFLRVSLCSKSFNTAAPRGESPELLYKATESRTRLSIFVAGRAGLCGTKGRPVRLSPAQPIHYSPFSNREFICSRNHSSQRRSGERACVWSPRRGGERYELLWRSRADIHTHSSLWQMSIG